MFKDLKLKPENIDVENYLKTNEFGQEHTLIENTSLRFQLEDLKDAIIYLPLNPQCNIIMCLVPMGIEFILKVNLDKCIMGSIWPAHGRKR